MRATSSAPSRTITALLTLALAATSAVVAGASLAPAAGAPAPRPSLALHAAKEESHVSRPRGEEVWAPLPVFVTPVGGAFDLRVRRADFFSPITVSQAVHEEDGSVTEYPLSTLVTKEWQGLRDFARITITNPKGVVTEGRTGTFCPNAWEAQRLSPDGAHTPTYPYWCGGGTLTLGSTWGIDDGWGVPVDERGAVMLDGPVGTWTVTITIRPKYQNLFGIDPADASSTVSYHVENGPGDHCRGCKEADRRPADTASGSTNQSHARLDVRTLRAAPPSANLPDLQSLPSFDIEIDHRGGKDFVAFASTVWVGGESKLDIEGFRRPHEDVMDAYQYFYDGDDVVGKAGVGTLEFDTRRGHHHWHLQQFAQYRLLDADQEHVRISKKQSFCLAPTDATNLAIDGAAWRETGEDLGSACGGDEAVWIREVLPLGWGDTYYQNRGGQDFNITGIPNGTYYVSVEANPTRELFETDTTNNEALRKIILKGQPGNRRICVPAVGVIRAEGTCR